MLLTLLALVLDVDQTPIDPIPNTNSTDLLNITGRIFTDPDPDADDNRYDAYVEIWYLLPNQTEFHNSTTTVFYKAGTKGGPYNVIVPLNYDVPNGKQKVTIKGIQRDHGDLNNVTYTFNNTQLEKPKSINTDSLDGTTPAPKTTPDDKKNKMIPIIAGVAAAAGVAAIAAGVIIAVHAAHGAQAANMNPANAQSPPDDMPEAQMTHENQMFNQENQDDPFVNEFDEAQPEGVFAPN